VSAPRAVLALLLALLASGGAARDARAAVEPPPISLSVGSCPPAWDPEIRLTVAVELGDERLADAPAEARPAAPGSPRAAGEAGYTLAVRCAEHRVQIVARDSKTALTLERTLTDVPDATAPRLIALVAVELLTTFNPALRRRLEASPARPSKPSPPPPPPPVAPPPPPEERRLSLTAGWVYRTFLASGGVQAWGGMLDGRRASQGGSWSAALGLELVADERSTDIGQTSALLGSARASAGGRVPLAGDRLVLSFDVGGRVGFVRLSGHADPRNIGPTTFVNPWAGPVATLRAQFGVSWFCAEIAAEAGWAAVSANGLVNGGAALAASGPWLAISLGLGSRR
jgi:hypothetical protein